MRTSIWMAPALESTARKAKRGGVVSMRPGFSFPVLLQRSPAEPLRIPQGPGGVCKSAAVVYVTIRQCYQEKRTKGDDSGRWKAVG